MKMANPAQSTPLMDEEAEGLLFMKGNSQDKP